MEIACDILKKTVVSHNKYNSIKENFASLNLMQLLKTNTLQNFLNIINDKKYINITSNLINYFCQGDINDDNQSIGSSILMAYCISYYSSELFVSYKTHFEHKLIMSANKVVIIIEKLLNEKTTENIYQELLNTVDHYYSLYKVWKSKDSINKMNDLFSEIENISNIVRLQIKKKIPADNYNYLLEKVDELFKLNIKYACRMLLNRYDIFKDLYILEATFWSSIEKYYNLYKESIMVILLAELKIKIIPLLDNPTDRKNIYYNVDIEEMISLIRNHQLNNEYLEKIINLLQNKINMIDINYKIIKYTPNNLINIFRAMYKSILIGIKLSPRLYD